MNKFMSGIMFAVGITAFGRGMYRLGQQNERSRNHNNWTALELKLKLMLAIMDEIEKRTVKEEA